MPMRRGSQRQRRFVTGLLLALLSTTAQSQADIPNGAAAALARGDYAEAYCFWRELADAGNADAQFNVGWMYHNGYGLKINDQTAAAWWQRAVDQQHPEATFALGNLYRLGGRGVKRDRPRALELLLQSAQGGNEDAGALLRALVTENHRSIREQIPELLRTQPQWFGNRRLVMAPRANVRSGPGTKNPVIATLERGDGVLELSRQGNWVQVKLSDTPQTGWMYHSLIQ